jgi:hypothetical protein
VAARVVEFLIPRDAHPLVLGADRDGVAPSRRGDETAGGGRHERTSLAPFSVKPITVWMWGHSTAMTEEGA